MNQALCCCYKIPDTINLKERVFIWLTVAKGSDSCPAGLLPAFGRLMGQSVREELHNKAVHFVVSRKRRNTGRNEDEIFLPKA